jgi:hypothetical protein
MNSGARGQDSPLESKNGGRERADRNGKISWRRALQWPAGKQISCARHAVRRCACSEDRNSAADLKTEAKVEKNVQAVGKSTNSRGKLYLRHDLLQKRTNEDAATTCEQTETEQRVEIRTEENNEIFH